MSDEPPSKPPSPDPSARDEAVSRRDVFGALGLAGVAVLTGGTVAHATAAASLALADETGRARAKPYVPGAEHFATGEERWVTTSCGQCPAGCGVRVRVVEGRAVRIEGNAANPLNRGGIGPRGLSSLQALYDADRIPGPLVREGGRLVPIAWDPAIALLAGKLAEVRTSRPHGLLLMTGRERGFMHDLLARFCESFGTPNFVDGRPSRSSTFAQAALATMGAFEVPTFDWSQAEYVLCLEAGTLEESCQSVYLARVAAEAHRPRSGRRTTTVHAGPTFDLSAHGADDWVRIHPGSSAALALGIAHVLVRDGRYDGKVASEGSEGFAAFARWLLDEHLPERAARVAGIPATRVEELANALASRRPSFVYADERTFAYSNGWETALAVLSLNALLGAIGPLVKIEPSPPYAPWPATDVDEAARAALAKPRLDRAGSAAFPSARAIHETLPEALTGPDAPSVVILDYANPAYAGKQPERWRRALASAPFVASFSPYPDETVESVAHLVLPDCTFLERWDDAGAPGAGTPVAGVRRPVVEPLLDTRATGDVVIQVARALGGSVARSFPWRSAREALEARLRGLFQARRGSIVDTKESAFLHRLYEQGFWADPEAPPVATKRFAFRAEYAAPVWEGDESAFPLALIVYRSLAHAEGTGANLPWLRQLRSRPDQPRAATYASVHPDSAPGIENGDTIEIASPFGAIVATARLDPRMALGCVAVAKGGGHEALGRWAVGRGANVMRLVAPGPAPRTGANAPSTTRVRIVRRKASR